MLVIKGENLKRIINNETITLITRSSRKYFLLLYFCDNFVSLSRLDQNFAIYIVTWPVQDWNSYLKLTRNLAQNRTAAQNKGKQFHILVSIVEIAMPSTISILPFIKQKHIYMYILIYIQIYSFLILKQYRRFTFKKEEERNRLPNWSARVKTLTINQTGIKKNIGKPTKRSEKHQVR